MKRIMRKIAEDCGRVLRVLPVLLVVVLCAIPAAAKLATDFNPNFDFSKYKTFAFIGGVEGNLHKQLNPDLLNNRFHRSITRELTAKGLREVSEEDNPDLVARYTVEASTDARITGSVYWGTYGYYYGYHWTYVYSTVEALSERHGTIGVELIDVKAKDLAWRLFASSKAYSQDTNKIWNQIDGNIKKAFKQYPPSAKDIEEKKKQWAKEDAEQKAKQQ